MSSPRLFCCPYPRGISCLLGALLFICGSCFAQAKPPAESFDVLAKRAAEARDSDRVDEAVRLYRKALAMKSTWAEGWWSLGTLEYDSNAYSAAAKSFQRVIELTPKYATAWMMLGLCQFELGQDDQALKSLETGRATGVVNEAQLGEVVDYHIGLLQLRKELYASALKTFQKLAADGVGTDEVALGLAMSLLMVQPSTLPAENTVERSIILGVGGAEILSLEKKSEEARRAYSLLVEQYPDHPGLHFAYGLFLLGVHEREGAVAQLQAELRVNPKHVIALFQLAALRAEDNPAEAVEYAKRAVALNPGPPFGHYLLGQFYLAAGNAAAAVPELERARTHMPNEPKIYFALGNAYAKVGRKEEAARARAAFRRLQSQEKNEGSASTYGQESQGLSTEGFAASSEEKPKE